MKTWKHLLGTMRLPFVILALPAYWWDSASTLR